MPRQERRQRECGLERSRIARMTPEQREQRLLHMREYHPQAIPRPHEAAALDESQFVAQIHGVERRLILVLQLASQAISMLDQPEQDLEEFKTGFEQKCVALGEVVTEIQSGLKALLQRFAATGVLDAAGQQLQYNITTAGEEKDLEILTNGVALLRDLLAQHSASAGAARPDGDAEMAL
nr:hypothetical protein HK105_006461 [Polyrhizophydium stewartii]